MIPGVHPLGGGGWVDGVGMSMSVWGGVPCTHACTCMHTHARTHARKHMHVKHVVNMINMDASMSVVICNFYTCINVHVCMCVCACACVHMRVRVWGDTPHPPDAPPLTCPLPRAAGSPKHQNSISPELIEIIPFCLKILYL